MQVADAGKNSPGTLNSWKEIASYLDRGVRTVQRWECELRLPVHRIGSGKRSPVYALVPELNFWLRTVEAEVAVQKEEPGRGLALERPDGEKLSPLRLSHELVERSHNLVRTMAEASVRQRRQTEILQNRILKLRSRIK